MKWLAKLSAWNSPFDPLLHCKKSSEILDARYAETEDGEVIVPYFTAEIVNPGVVGIGGLPGQYYVLSEQWPGDPGPVEKARGRLSNLPSELGAKTCTLEFFCLPPDEDDVLKAAANLLRVGEIDYDPDAPQADREAAECYDPLFYSPDAIDDPAGVLLARPEVWRWNERMLAPERVHLTDGVTEHRVTMALDQTFSLHLLNPPKAVSKLRLLANWTQTARGRQTFNRLGETTTYSYEDFSSTVPKSGDPIGSETGWTFDDFEVTSVQNAPSLFRVQANSPEYGDAAGGYLRMRAKTISWSWRAAYSYEQARSEIIDILMPAAAQPVLGDSKTEVVEQISLGQLNLDLVTPEWQYEDPETLDVTHYEIGDQVQAAGRVWKCVVEHDAQPEFKVYEQNDDEVILWEQTTKRSAMPDIRIPNFADRPRGKRAIRHGIRRLYREVLKRGRAVEISFSCPYSEARYVTCRDTVRLEHGRLVGGECVGKVTAVEHSLHASLLSKITILCSIGTGIAPPVAGDDDQTTGLIVYRPTYGTLSTPVDALSLAGMGPYSNELVNEAATQESIGLQASAAGLDPVKAMGSVPTRLEIGYAALREEDLLRRRVTVTCQPAFLPKQINLSPET